MGVDENAQRIKLLSVEVSDMHQYLANVSLIISIIRPTSLHFFVGLSLVCQTITQDILSACALVLFSNLSPTVCPTTFALTLVLLNLPKAVNTLQPHAR